MKSEIVLIDGKKYHAINIIRKENNRLIIRMRATGGQTFHCELQKKHCIILHVDGEPITIIGSACGSGNNVKTEEIEFSIESE